MIEAGKTYTIEMTDSEDVLYMFRSMHTTQRGLLLGKVDSENIGPEVWRLTIKGIEPPKDLGNFQKVRTPFTVFSPYPEGSWLNLVDKYKDTLTEVQDD